MGITGLLPFLDKAKTEINVRTLANKSVAIDTYCWLHKGAFGVGDKLARGEKTDIHIKYCLKFVNMLLSHNIKPILVFDGRHLPAKADTEAKRRERRKADKQRAIELMRKGRHSEASKFLRRCVDITHEMAHELIEQCRAINVDCIVAPYEADAQLAYLNKIGLAEYVITEDSDLTLFGCTKILFKLDLTGACVLVESDKFHLAMNCALDKFSMDKFRLMCVVSGCDYIDSLPGIGLVKACKFVMMTEETNLWRALDKIPAYLNMRQLTVSDEYKENVHKALATFLHMVVYDPRQRKQVRLNDIEEIGTEEVYCTNSGEFLDDGPSLDLAVGNLNPFTMARLDDWHPDKRQKKPPIDIKTMRVAKHPSIWQQDYRFNVSLNKPKTDTKKVFDTTAVRRSKRSLPPQNASAELNADDQDISIERDEDIMNQYANLTEPQQKRFKDEMIEQTDEPSILKSPPTPKRNPFKTSNPCTNDLLSPTRISKENNSLVRNQSPVKRIDFNKIRKLSRFDRTAGSANQQTLSHFFAGDKSSPSLQSPRKSTEMNGVSKKTSVESGISDHELDESEEAPPYFHMKTEEMTIDEKCDMEESPPKAILTDAYSALNKFLLAPKNRMESDDSAVCLSQTSSVTVQSNVGSDEGESEDMETESEAPQIEVISDASNEPVLDAADESESVDAAIEISDEEVNSERSLRNFAAVEIRTKANQPISKRVEKKKSAQGCRKVGLRSKASQAKTTQSKSSQSGAVQMRLQMFGFQAKPRAS